ncbi:MAG: metal ABC transporter substrate-binding protein [Propionibacteriaceae bacterium]
MFSRSFRIPSALLAVTLATSFTACGNKSEQSTTDKKVTIVATTVVLGDIVRQLTDCAGGNIVTLMPEGADAHDWSMSSQQATELLKASLVVTNGLELEGGIEDILANAKKDGAKVFTVADKLDPIDFGSTEHEHDHEHESTPGATPNSEHDHGDKDPHFWLDAQRGAKAATLIANEIATATGVDTYKACGNTVNDRLMAVDKKVADTLAELPEEKRILVTDHDAFGYFAKRYGFEVAGVVIPGGSTDAEPSSADIAELVETIKHEKVSAIFSNTATNPKLTETVAKEVGSQVKVVALFESSTSQKDGVKTYADMLTRNAELIVTALR